MSALSNVRVLELAGMGPTPFCGMLLGDMGADVLRIDRMAPTKDGIAMAAAADLRGRNKRSARIDIKHPRGRDAFLKLVERADVLIEGYRPGVTERMGIGPDVCLKINPALVYARATGWGREGPLAMAAGPLDRPQSKAPRLQPSKTTRNLGSATDGERVLLRDWLGNLDSNQD